MTEQMTAPATIAGVLERIRASRADFDTAVARLTDDQFTAPGAEGDSSVKDLVAHVAGWEQGIAALLQHEPRFEAMGIEDASAGRDNDMVLDTDTVNERLHALHLDRPSHEVLTMAHEAHERVLAVIATLNDDDLQRPYREFSEENRPNNHEPVINWIAGDTYEHYEDHTPSVQAQATTG